MPLRVIGTRTEVIPVNRRGDPSCWTPAEGGAIDDVKIYSGARLDPIHEASLLADDRFIRAVKAAL